MAATFLILLGAIIGTGFVGNLFFERTRVPPVLLLIAVGMVLGPLAHVVPPEAVRPFTPFFGAVELTIILFEGGLDLDLRHALRQAGFCLYPEKPRRPLRPLRLIFLYPWRAQRLL